jgi:iron complex outermembrane receptor protein
VINAQSYQGVAASSVARYYMAAPRFVSATLSVDF